MDYAEQTAQVYAETCGAYGALLDFILNKVPENFEDRLYDWREIYAQRKMKHEGELKKIRDALDKKVDEKLEELKCLN